MVGECAFTVYLSAIRALADFLVDILDSVDLALKVGIP